MSGTFAGPKWFFLSKSRSCFRYPCRRVIIRIWCFAHYTYWICAFIRKRTQFANISFVLLFSCSSPFFGIKFSFTSPHIAHSANPSSFKNVHFEQPHFPL
eukprot:UN22567